MNTHNLNKIHMKTINLKWIPFVCGILLLNTSCRRSTTDYDASGSFEAVEVIVSSEANGKIQQFKLEEGVNVKAGEILGVIDTTQLYLKKLQLLQSIKAANSRKTDVDKQIAALQQQITTAKTEKTRIENLLKADATNRKQLDDINAQIATLNKQLDAQKSAMEKGNNSISEESGGLEIQIAQIEDQLKKCYITSPINGNILVKYAEFGELAVAGKALFKVADMSNIILRVYVTSEQLAQLNIGKEVEVFADYTKDVVKKYKGTIEWISDKSEFTPKTIQTRDERANLVYAVKVSVKNDGYLKIGMYGGINIPK